MTKFRLEVYDRVTGDTSRMSINDVCILAAFSTPEKPISLEEFQEFWDALDHVEKMRLNDVLVSIFLGKKTFDELLEAW